MMRLLLTGNGAAAWGARLAMVDFVSASPNSPQTELIETLASWIEQGTIAGKLVTLESEHSMITAAAAAAISGVRVFAASSPQGLLSAMEVLFHTSSWRAPIVLVNVSSEFSIPNTIGPDQHDILATRDSGLLQLHCATPQEVLDMVLLAHRLAEDIRLPVLVNQGGFNLSFTREPVVVPNATTAKQFVGSYDLGEPMPRTSMPLSHATAALGGAAYAYFRYEMQLTAQQALVTYAELADEFRDFFGRFYPAIDAYCSDDAEFVFVVTASLAAQAKEAVDRLRDSGWKIGLVRPRLLRPFPQENFARLLRGKQAVAVIDQNISLGMGGILHTELAAALYNQKDAPSILASFIGGLGNRDITIQDFFEMASELREAVARGESPASRLLFNADEFQETRKLHSIAQVERHTLG